MMSQDEMTVEEYDASFAYMPFEESAAYREWLARFEAEHFATCEFDI